MKQVQIILTGRVQGVYFRASAKKQADQLGVFGWARNTEDGNVEIIAQGKKENLMDFILWCHTGSVASNVESVHVKWDKANEAYSEFHVVRAKEGLIQDQIQAYKNFAKNIFGSFLVSKDQNKLEKIEVIPNHVVIIPDGNRRWAKEHGWKVWKGHDAGRKNAEVILDELRKHGVKYATLWAFSTENWKRSQEEVEQLMNIFNSFIDELLEKSHKDKIRCVHFGRKDRLPKNIVKKLTNLEAETSKYQNFHIGLAIDYGGRDEIIRGFRELTKNKLEVTEENISNVLDTKDFPDPDLIIRTSGEQRLSGMMPWQGVYAEISFVEKYFPALDSQDIYEILADFSQRKRRFGK